mmetsp:Transcript_47196/g.137272  ORF Transcript_47196/g.137272 Transcript_47196/m.137272 type:complete len:359 (+) Transcript_47196:556-1632(+)
MTSNFPAPPGTISAKTSLKCSLTRRSVCNIADSFCSSICSRACLMDSSPASISTKRRSRSRNCSAKFSYCSTALRLTFWKPCICRPTSASSRTSSGFGNCRACSRSAAGTARLPKRPSTSAFFCACAVASVSNLSKRRLTCVASSCNCCSWADNSSRRRRRASQASAKALASAAAATAPSEASRCSRSRRAQACAASSARSKASSWEPAATSNSKACSRFLKQPSNFASNSPKAACNLDRSAFAASRSLVPAWRSSDRLLSRASSSSESPRSVFDARSPFLAFIDASHSPMRTVIRCFHSWSSLMSRAYFELAASKLCTFSVSFCIDARTPSRRSCRWRRSACSESKRSDASDSWASS